MTEHTQPCRTHSESGSARCWALIACAGSGSRAGGAAPKQYQSLAGQALVLHTLAAFADVARIANSAVVVAPDDDFFDAQIAVFQRKAKGHGDPRCSSGVLVAHCGGATRAASVSNGLKFLLDHGAATNDWVLVHDAARCLITPEQIDALIDACVADAVGGLLAYRLSDTLKSAAHGRVAVTLERHDKWLAQTPQMFRIGMLVNAMEQAGDQVTDEASAVEAIGLHPLLVPGSAQNFKVTYPEDFVLAEAVLSARARNRE